MVENNRYRDGIECAYNEQNPDLYRCNILFMYCMPIQILWSTMNRKRSSYWPSATHWVPFTSWYPDTQLQANVPKRFVHIWSQGFVSHSSMSDRKQIYKMLPSSCRNCLIVVYENQHIPPAKLTVLCKFWIRRPGDNWSKERNTFRLKLPLSNLSL